MPKNKPVEKLKSPMRKSTVLSIRKTKRNRPSNRRRSTIIPPSPTSVIDLANSHDNNERKGSDNNQNECSIIKSACRNHKWKDGRKQPDNSGKYKKCYYAISRGNWSPPHEQAKYYAHPDKGGNIKANQRLNRCIGQESDYGLNSDSVEEEGGELHDGKSISKEEREERKAEFFSTIRARNPNISVEILERLWEEYNSNIRIGQNTRAHFSGTRKRSGKGRKRKSKKKRRRKKKKTKKRRKRKYKTKTRKRR